MQKKSYENKSLMGFKIWWSWESGSTYFKITPGTTILCFLAINLGFSAGGCSFGGEEGGGRKGKNSRASLPHASIPYYRRRQQGSSTDFLKLIVGSVVRVLTPQSQLWSEVKVKVKKWKVKKWKWSKFWVFEFYETFICYRGSLT